MQILLACAKLMATSHMSRISTSTPEFQKDTEKIALQMAQYTPEELSGMLGINHKIATENFNRYRDFFDPSTLTPALFAYDGIVFKTMNPESMSDSDLCFANSHINICSFLYGLLRPSDAINPYRLEGSAELPGIGDGNLFDYWKPKLTETLIARCKADDGTLLNLASDEMKSLFNWKHIQHELHVISPQFKVVKNGKPRSIVVYAKICRGAMTRKCIINRISDPRMLADFHHDGFMLEGPMCDTPLFLRRDL